MVVIIIPENSGVLQLSQQLLRVCHYSHMLNFFNSSASIFQEDCTNQAMRSSKVSLK